MCGVRSVTPQNDLGGYLEGCTEDAKFNERHCELVRGLWEEGEGRRALHEKALRGKKQVAAILMQS